MNKKSTQEEKRGKTRIFVNRLKNVLISFFFVTFDSCTTFSDSQTDTNERIIYSRQQSKNKMKKRNKKSITQPKRKL